MPTDTVCRPRARIDLLEIYLSIARANPGAADKICDAIEARAALLATYPRDRSARYSAEYPYPD